ncbi:DHA2 family multidrug resistance protein [Filimonas zeae]|uniref:MFS transporter n=1 Tax=Filimonas zeae TaxID=1737353 RepID=A0A917MS23_9BACT|nr:MFS transporter [Filimonas zeae]MDR6337732.1 DHA2 family multidrug resistance protein [Filimonas zeae]GGH59996.1 MFS transporter [Filimonas zeae]
MNKPTYFQSWLEGWEWGIRIALFLILLSALFQFGMFALTQNYMISYLGAQPEDISFALLLTYAGIISILPVQFRFLRYFEMRSYLLVNVMFAIGLNILCMHCNDLGMFFVYRFLQGILVGNTAACILILVFSRLQTERAQAIGSAVFYGAILSNTVIIGMLASWVVTTYDWQRTYYYLIGFQLVIIVIILFLLKASSGYKRYPLYQVDWAAFVIFCATASALAYLMIYGSKFYWFADARIQKAAFVFLCGLLLFLYRCTHVKRPLISLSILRSPNVVVGLCLLAIYYGSKDSVNLIYNYAFVVLKWSTWQVMQLGCMNLLGIVSLIIPASRIMIRHRHSSKYFIVSGFCVMGMYHIWMCFLFTPDLSYTDLMIPVFLQGAASGLLFVPIVIFVLSSAPGNTGTTGIVVAAYARFMASLHSVAGFYNLQLYFNQYYRLGFLKNITGESQETITRLGLSQKIYISGSYSAEQAAALANASIAQSLNLQSQLLTYRAVFMTLGVAMFGVALLVLMVPAINKTYLHWNKRMFMLTR